jgi:hypothetical protein
MEVQEGESGKTPKTTHAKFPPRPTFALTKALRKPTPEPTRSRDKVIPTPGKHTVASGLVSEAQDALKGGRDRNNDEPQFTKINLH